MSDAYHGGTICSLGSVIPENAAAVWNIRFGSLADIGEGYQGCPLYPQKGTCLSLASMSAMCH